MFFKQSIATRRSRMPVASLHALSIYFAAAA